MDAIQLGRLLWDQAEAGFFERRTHDTLGGLFKDLEFEVDEFDEMPGFIAHHTESNPDLALIADMDALPTCGSYRHICGHHLQMTALYATAARLQATGSSLLQRLAFVAIPGEEFIDLDRREELRQQGAISCLSGKQELLHRGLFDQFSAVVATHAAPIGTGTVNSVVRMNGFEVLNYTFSGLSAHAGAAPHAGVNAQNAAALFLQSCAFLRESFDERKHIRIHPVISLKEDQTVNLIPDLARVETYVRAVDPEAIEQTIDKLTAAARGCAQALGASVECRRIPGYAPFSVDEDLHRLVEKIAAQKECAFVEDPFSAASSDMGDVSQIKPAVIIGLPGTNGLFHNPDFRVVDEAAAYEFPAEFLCDYLNALGERPRMDRCEKPKDSHPQE